LLNVPPTRAGRLHENDVAALHEFGELLRKTFARNLAAHAKVTASNVRGNNLAKFGPKHLLTEDRSTYWATDDGLNTPEVAFDLYRPITFNVIRIREAIQFGQRIGGIVLEQSVAGAWRPLATATSIGACRLIRLESPSTATQLRLRVTESSAAPALTEVSFFTEAT
jgi:alpha-L-fucosidase